MAASNAVTTDLTLNDTKLQQSMARIEKMFAEFGKRIEKAVKPKDGKGLFEKLWGGMHMGSMAMGALQTVAGWVGQAIGKEVERDRVNRKLEQALIATGNATGFTKDQLEELASTLSKSTLHTKGQVMQAEALLATFTNVRGDVFVRALKAASDLAEFMDTDLVTAAQKVGRALNDPAKGMEGLGELVGKLNDKQTKAITAMLQRGDIVKAQEAILSIIEGKFKDAGERAAKGFAGKWAMAMKNFNSMLSDLGRAFGPMIDRMTEKFKTLSEFFAGAGGQATIAKWVEMIESAIGKVLPVIGNIIDGIVSGFGKTSIAISAFVTNFKLAMDVAATYMELKLSQAFDNLKAQLVSLVKTISQTLKDATDLIWENMRRLGETLASFSIRRGFQVPFEPATDLPKRDAKPVEVVPSETTEKLKTDLDALVAKWEQAWKESKDQSWLAGWEVFTRRFREFWDIITNTKPKPPEPQKELPKPAPVNKPFEFSRPAYKPEYVGLSEMGKRIQQGAMMRDPTVEAVKNNVAAVKEGNGILRQIQQGVQKMAEVKPQGAVLGN